MSSCGESGLELKTFKAEINSLEPARNFVVARAQAAGLAGEKMLNLQLALEEMTVNVVRYAYPADGGMMDVGCGIGPDGAEFRVLVRDSGRPFNPLDRQAPNLSDKVDERPIGGLGIYLTRKVTDRMEYARENGQNTLTMCFNIPRAENARQALKISSP